VLHVTSEAERAASLARLRRAQGVIVPNGVESADDLPPRTWRPDGRLRLMYIGRLDSRKGLENLLRAINRLDGMSVTLDIYGTGEQRYAASLAELSRALGLSERVRFQGHVETGAKRNAFLSADVCVVPSTTENFGMVVAEALAHGVPVIASRGTPWAEVESHNCGLWVDNTPSELAGAIERVRDMDLKTMGERGRKWMRDEFRWESIASRMYRVYEVLTRICAS
jgi:glycosyltransferase involved in cell wall biosynthesis